jgi:hypothetical protein
MSDIVERLSALAFPAGFQASSPERETCLDALNEIQRLRAENERLLAVAQGDARMLAAYHKWCEMNGCAPSSSDLSVAFAALAEQEKK